MSKLGLLLSLMVVHCLQGPTLLAQSNAPRVEVQKVRIQPIFRKVELSGTVISPHVSQISTSVEGLVKKLFFGSGANVKKGELMLTLDSEVQNAALAQSKARVAQSEAELADAKRRLRIAKDLARRAHGPKNQVDDRLAEIQIDSAALESSKAEQTRLAAILERHKLKAPFTGIISKKLVEVGQWVTPGTPVFELVDMQDLLIEIPVPQQYYTALKQGADISLQFEALPDTVMPANVKVIVPVSNPDARTFTLRVLPKNKQLPITPGMSARVTISLDTGQKNVAVNRDALIRYPDGRVIVWVLEKEGDKTSVKERRVEIGLAFDQYVQILSGLKEGDQVVVRGNEALRDGQTVQLAS